MIHSLFSFGFYAFLVGLLMAGGIGVLALAGSDDFKVAKACFVGAGLYSAAELIYLAVKYGSWNTYPLFALVVTGCLWFCVEASGYVDRKRADRLAKEVSAGRRGLTFYIDEKSIRVGHCGESRDVKGNVTSRSIMARIRLNCSKDVDSKLAVRQFDATLLVTKEETETVFAEGRLVNAYIDNPAKDRIRVEEGWVIDEPLTSFRWYWFIFEIETAMTTRLTAEDPFFRVTMVAVGQESQHIDFSVKSWEDALTTDSGITLR